MHRVRYVPVDISESAMIGSATELSTLYGALNISGILTDFTKNMYLLPLNRKLILFLGSSIGNFSPAGRIALLKDIAGRMGPGDQVLLGLDMLKPAHILETAYNDRAGLTSRFNRNILEHLNRRLNADFIPHEYEHLARFLQSEERVEMRLRAVRDARVNLARLGITVNIKKRETILTEICQKFTLQGIGKECAEAGLSMLKWFTDDQGWFCLIILEKSLGFTAPWN